MHKTITNHLDEHNTAFKKISGDDYKDLVIKISEKCADSLKNGGTLFFAGNGGSAADAQHLAAELTGRYLKDRSPLSGIALNTNTSSITAIANDYSFEDIFSRQLEALGRGGDVLIAFSTSGTSTNIINCLKTAKKMNIFSIGFTGENGSSMGEFTDLLFKAPSSRTPVIQELHITTGHIICNLIEDIIFG